MPLVFQYLLKLSISLTILYLFYYFVLRRLTFYTYNRWYLLGYSLLSFFIAAVDITSFINNNTPATFTWLQHFPTVQQLSATPIPVNQAAETAVTVNTWQFWDYAVCIFITGIVFLLGRLAIQVLSFRKIKRKATFIPSGDIHVYQVNAPIIPFSFGKNIYINSSLHAPQELEKIIQHEFVHVKQKHTIDIICSEIICFLNWYNPFAWLIRKAVRQNLEYIADDTVLRNGINKKEYQYLLLKVIGNQKFSIATPFNFSSLKKRIAMMNKLKTSKVHVLKFLFLLPLMASVLLAFRSKIADAGNSSFTYGGMVINSQSGQPMAHVKVLELNSGTTVTTDQNGFFSFKATDKIIDHKLSLDGNTSSVHFTYSRSADDGKSFLVLVKAAQNGSAYKVLSSSIAMEWDGSLEQAITRSKSYAEQPEVKEQPESVTQGNIRAEASGGVMGWSGNKPDDDMFITADTIHVIIDKPKGFVIYADKMYTARDYKEQLAGKVHAKQVYFFSKENSKRIWGKSAGDGVIMINDNPSFTQYATALTDTVPGSKKLQNKRNTNKYPDTLTWVHDGREAHDSFIKRHPEVRNIDWMHSSSKAKHTENGKVISNTNDHANELKLTLKNGNIEKYDLDNDSDLQRFKDKYGELPVQAPPPPMPPSVPATPKNQSKTVAPTPPTPPKVSLKKADVQELQLVKKLPAVTVQDQQKPALSEVKLEYVKVDDKRIAVEKLNTEQLELVKKLPGVAIENTPRLELKEVKIDNVKLNDTQVPVKKLNPQEIQLVKKLPGVTVETKPQLTLKEVKVEKIKSKE